MIEYDLNEDLMRHLLFCLDEKPDARECKWVMHPRWMMEIRRLVDSSNRPLLEPTLTLFPSVFCRDSEPATDMLYGYPIETDINAGPPHLESA